MDCCAARQYAYIIVHHVNETIHLSSCFVGGCAKGLLLLVCSFRFDRHDMNDAARSPCIGMGRAEATMHASCALSRIASLRVCAMHGAQAPSQLLPPTAGGRDALLMPDAPALLSCNLGCCL